MDRREFDRFVTGLDSPMQVVTTAADGERAGCLVGFGSEVSIEPPLYLVCLSVKNRTHEVARGAELLAVHLLGPDQHDLAELFGGETGDEVDKFERWPWHAGPDGVPLLEGCPRVMVGRVVERRAWGDHTAHLLEPVALEVRDGEPGLDLTDVEDLEPGHEA
jgi:flavin reductase (DIM6/NTAB) family NADH-FMN oxidoreductase RutF